MPMETILGLINMYFCKVFQITCMDILSQLKILRMADNSVCSPIRASLCCFSTTDDTHSMKLDSLENALLAMLPVEVVLPERSGRSTFNPVFSCTRFRRNIMDGGYQ